MSYEEKIASVFKKRLEEYIEYALMTFSTSEEQRNYCYQLDNLNDYMHEKWDLDITEIETGSTTECCGIFSDIDRMLFTKDFIVVESIEQISEKHSKGVLLMDTSGCHPGYVRLKLERPHPEGKMDLFTELNGDYFLLASKFKWFVIRQKKGCTKCDEGRAAWARLYSKR